MHLRGSLNAAAEHCLSRLGDAAGRLADQSDDGSAAAHQSGGQCLSDLFTAIHHTIWNGWMCSALQ